MMTDAVVTPATTSAGSQRRSYAAIQVSAAGRSSTACLWLRRRGRRWRGGRRRHRRDGHRLPGCRVPLPSATERSIELRERLQLVAPGPRELELQLEQLLVRDQHFEIIGKPRIVA